MHCPKHRYCMGPTGRWLRQTFDPNINMPPLLLIKPVGLSQSEPRCFSGETFQLVSTMPKKRATLTVVYQRQKFEPLH